MSDPRLSTRLQFRLGSELSAVIDEERALSMVGSEVPVRWGDESVPGKVISVRSTPDGIEVLMEVELPSVIVADWATF